MIQAISCCCPALRISNTVVPSPSGTTPGLLIETAPSRFIHIVVMTADCGRSNESSATRNGEHATGVDIVASKLESNRREAVRMEEENRTKQQTGNGSSEGRKTGHTPVSKAVLPLGSVVRGEGSNRGASEQERSQQRQQLADGTRTKWELNEHCVNRNQTELGEMKQNTNRGKDGTTARDHPSSVSDDQRPVSKREAGNTTIFFIHGVGGNGSVWTKQLKHFYELGYNVISVDMIGHGRSSTPRSKTAYTFQSIQDDIFYIFDRFARDRNVIIAHSYGTCFAAVLARQRVDKISHLVLINCGAPVPLDPADGAFALPDPILALLRPALTQTFMKLAFMSTPSSNDMQSSFASVKTGVLKRVMQGQRWPDCTIPYHQQIRTPTLLIYGRCDGLVSLGEMYQMHEAIPGSVLEVVEYSSHMVMIEQAAAVNRLIEGFLRKTIPQNIAKDAKSEDEVHSNSREHSRPTTATSRTIPPSKAFRIRSHESLTTASRASVNREATE